MSVWIVIELEYVTGMIDRFNIVGVYSNLLDAEIAAKNTKRSGDNVVDIIERTLL